MHSLTCTDAVLLLTSAPEVEALFADSDEEEETAAMDYSLGGGGDSVCVPVGGQPKTFLKQTAHRCVVCTKLLGSDKAKQTMWECPTCAVALCTTKHGKQRSTCYERFHSVKNLNSLLKSSGVTPDGSVAQAQSTRSTGTRKSPRRHN